MPEDFYPFVDGARAADENPIESDAAAPSEDPLSVNYATRIAVYDDMLSTPRVIVIMPSEVRHYLEEVTNTVYRTMREQGGRISLMVIRELVENFIHARFTEPVISILDDGNTIRFADQGPGIEDKERAFEFGITSANTAQKRYIRGTGAGLPMVEQYLENAGGVIAIENNLNQGTVVTVTIDSARADEVRRSVSRGAVVKGIHTLPYSESSYQQPSAEFSTNPQPYPQQTALQSEARRPSVKESGSSVMRQIDSQLSERGVVALTWAAEHGSVGPTDLATAFGESTPTWSRELSKLSTVGLLVKQGQRRILTEMGRIWFEEHEEGEA